MRMAGKNNNPKSRKTIRWIKRAHQEKKAAACCQVELTNEPLDFCQEKVMPLKLEEKGHYLLIDTLLVSVING